jgi:multidrug resistance efflux pump
MSRLGIEQPAKLIEPALEPADAGAVRGAPKSRTRQRAAKTSAALSDLDAAQRVAYLRKVYEEQHAAPQPRPAEHPASPARRLGRGWFRLYVRSRHTLARHVASPQQAWSLTVALASPLTLRRMLKTVAALTIALAVGWGPTQRLLQTTSVEAVVNARLITLRAPIEGEIAATPTSLTIGAELANGAALMKVVDRRADRTRLDDLRRTIAGLEDERAMLAAKLANTRSLHAEFVTQTRQFQDGRVRQLEARTGELRSEISAAEARRQETAAVLQRVFALEAKGAAARATLDKAQRDDEIATQSIRAMQQRLKAVEIELDAARSGFFLGDSYNDRPRSAQRADELQQQAADLSVELEQREARLTRLAVELAEERSRFADLAEAVILAPTNGSVWEVLTAPGEQVNRGQNLARMLDCSKTLVTATVAEAVYNRLRVGQPARFRFREGGEELVGRVVHLTGVAAAPANFAIAPSALTKGAYRVTVAIPALAQSPTCHLGRTGRVTFASQPAADPPVTASVRAK